MSVELIAQKVAKFLGYFCKKICCKKLLKSPNLVTLATTMENFDILTIRQRKSIK